MTSVLSTKSASMPRLPWFIGVFCAPTSTPGATKPTEITRSKIRVYWSLIGPFSGLIRKAILKQVKTEAEAVLKGAS